MGIGPGRSGDHVAFADHVREQLGEHCQLAGFPQGESFHLITET
jgi:hypothetical protein